MPGGRGSDSVGRGASDASRGSSKSDNKGSDKGSSRGNGGNKGSDKESRGGSFGSIGDHQSYGMDKGSFDNSIGRDRDRGGNGGDNKPSAPDSVTDSIGDWVDDKWQGVKDFFGGKEDTGGFSPMGGPESYGMSNKQFDTTIGKRRQEARSLDQRLAREIDYFREAPLDYAADLLDNPLVSLATAASGLGMTAFGIKAVDAIADYYQAEASPLQTVKSLAGNIVESTPVGSVLGPMRQIVAAGIKDVDTIAPGLAAKGTAMATAPVASRLASSLTSNPYARAALAVGATTGAAAYAKGLVSDAQKNTGTPSGTQVAAADTPRRGGSDRVESPLVSSGEQAIASSKRLMQPAQSDLYAQTVKQLPFYGLGNSQLPYYGA